VPIKVLVADDSGAMRGAIVRLLEEDSALQVVGEARSFAQTVELTAALKPDIILLDLRMQDEKSFSPDVLKVQLLVGQGASLRCLSGMVMTQRHSRAVSERKCCSTRLIFSPT
jgi:DNA-binding NarL/FixJ family response regulator